MNTITTWLLLVSVAVIAVSGAPGLFFGRRSMIGQWIAAALNIVASALGGAALLIHVLRPDLSNPIAIRWSIPFGQFAIAVDDISLIFLIPIFLISALGSIYGLGYWKQTDHIANGRKLRLFWGIMTAAMAMVVMARDGVLFLIAWEIMALAGFFLIVTEDDNQQARDGAWNYLVAAHLGALCLFGFFIVLAHITGSFALWPTSLPLVSSRMTAGLLIAGTVGFGLKAGIMPLHVWLPGGHANAPSHVSAILSGVLLKTGVYGLVRLAGMMPNPPLWWGSTLLIAGAFSAMLGIAFASGQRDLKRLLAYSSIENIGIIVMGLGLATLGRSLHHPAWVVLGLGGSLLHVINHSLFKPMLFMGAGSVVHAAHTRDIDLLGGLGKSMPRTFVMFVIGAAAICGLPPLNGFVSELLIYLGLFRTASDGAGWGWMALAAPALALVGAMAVASFVKLLGAVFAGLPRSDRAAAAHDPHPAMLGPMWFLAGCCVIIGVLPVMASGVLNRAIAGWTGSDAIANPTLGGLVNFRWLSAMACLLLAAVAGGAVLFRRWSAGHATGRAGTWDCGYAQPSARMEYTGSSFTQSIVDLLTWALWPRKKQPVLGGVFASPSSFASEVPDTVLDRGVIPAFSSARWLMGWARFMQSGPMQLYILYVMAILILLLLFA
jgi:hydrogenase-4 component B